MRQSTIRQLLDAEASRLLATEPDLGPRVVAALAAERRSRERRLSLATAAAAALLVAWLGAAPVGGALRLTGDLAAPRPTPTQGVPAGYLVPGSQRAAETPPPRGSRQAGTRTPTAVALISGPAGAATATATTTSTPTPAR